MDEPRTLKNPPLVGASSRSLSQLIFQAELPERFIRSVPAQSLYLAAKQLGLASAADLLEMASPEQSRLMLDLDVWQKDRFNEDNFWEWLAVPDAAESLDFLKKFITFVDLKLVSLLLDRYVQVQLNEEPTDMPPGPGFHTPDKGHTWIKVDTSDSHREFLFSRLLAAIFEADPDLFYRLLSVPAVATPAMLEEEAYQEKQKRLTAEGLPQDDEAYRINSPADTAEAVRLLRQHASRPILPQLPAVTPLLYDSRIVQPLSSLINRLDGPEEFISEFTLVMNAAIVYWQVEISELEQVQRLADKVKGAINIGLQTLIAETQSESLEIYQCLGLQKLYACGLARVLPLRKRASAVPDDALRGLDQEPASLSVLAGLREPFPEMPTFLQPDGSFLAAEDGTLAPGFKAIETVQEVESLEGFLTKKGD